MGKLAATLGIGVKGSVAIRLEGTVYRPGETLVGQVTLRIDEAFDGKAFEMTIAGEETLKWRLRRNSSHTLDQNQTEYDHHERRRHLLYHQLVFAPPQWYAPGDYVYPFEVALPRGLPSTVDYRASSVSDMQDIHGSVFYYATASLPADGTFKADLSSYHSFEIASAPQRLPESLQASATEERVPTGNRPSWCFRGCGLKPIASNRIYPVQNSFRWNLGVHGYEINSTTP